MIKRKTIISLLVSGVVSSTFLLGCGCNTAQGAKEDVKKGVDKVEEGTENVADDVKNAGTNLYDKVTDNSMEYSNEDFTKALSDKGLTATKFENTSEYFKTDKYGYKIGDESIYVYQYDTKAEENIKNDINSISNNGTTINGATVKWGKEPHIYKKGRILVVYDGNSENVLNNLKSILGDPILG